MTEIRPQSSTLPGAQTPSTPGRKVAGWLLVCFAVIPLAMAARGEGARYLWTGAAIAAVGGALVLVPGRSDQT